VDLERFLLLSAVLFAIGLYGAMSRRNIIVILMSIEIMFNAVNVAFLAFSRYVEPAALRQGGDAAEHANALLTGQAFAIFVVVVAAAEVALALALVLAFFRHRDSVDVTTMSLLKR
jgi:NADH:ubiquinone oxidoreductase subunit K